MTPTFEATPLFWRDHAALTDDQRAAFRRAVEKFVEDLPTRAFRASLRIRGIQGTPGVFEMTWAPDGRATFQYGTPPSAEEAHILWRRVGTHEIFGSP